MSCPVPTEDELEDALLSCRYGDLDDLNEFIDKFGNILDRVLSLVPLALLEVKNASGSTALHWAALNSQLECARKLVQVPDGPGVNLIDIKNNAGLSPLAEAERVGWDEGAKWFVEVMNLETDQDVKEEETDAPVDPKAVEIEIEDADGGVAKMSLAGSESKS